MPPALSRPMSLASEPADSAPPRTRFCHGRNRWPLDRDRHSAVRVAHQRVEVSRVSRLEAAVVEIHLPLELADRPKGLDEDAFVRIDRVKARLTPSSQGQSWVPPNAKRRLVVPLARKRPPESATARQIGLVETRSLFPV